MINRFKRRPWGWWLVLLDRPHFKVKLLRFKAGEKLSFQYHKYRSELWLFLNGQGKFTLVPDDRRNDDPNGEFLTNAHSVIMVGRLAKHSYIASKTSYILEVQYGDRCVEEDIVRL